MKTAVYSWRLSVELKTHLERQAREEGRSLSDLLEELASDGLRARRSRFDDEAEQAAIRLRAAAAIGSVRGGDPTRASRARELVREIVKRKHQKESRVSRRTD